MVSMAHADTCHATPWTTQWDEDADENATCAASARRPQVSRLN
ncbi:hypothetical protein ANO14919_092160 [Xylariales sp. No.14919]|nr:hypothetical protein ANO14919_092160 [Xylariales sp. No.14919]